ncbi:MAG TPA: cysteine--tRNA ligase [Candidatus Scatovivens faecipullorum]|nr:cysteine--tRNA ligase [Candidatus Scatovivens faecipullorum]
MSIKFFNTLTRKKEEFKPIDEKEIKMYSCGPTVYYYAHIGNLRAYLFMDNLRRVLKYNGYRLKHVMNITDVGHLVSDADEGEDKMMKAAKRENKNPFEIAEFYMNAFLKDIDSLNIDRPEIIARATEHIDIMEEYVKKIIENGFTYQTEDTVYFDTSKLDKYGILSNRSVENQKAGARVDFDKNKKNISDFALWIKAPENHIMKWDSFFGKAYPGWHLECSAMSYKYLGEHFDIHTGGVDHIPIHHENEIAQSKGFCGKIPANYWMHVEFLQINGGKMSKSLNNLYTLKDLQEKGYEPLVYRMFNYTSNYRAQINFTFEAMDSAKIALNRLREGYLKHSEGTDEVSDEEIKSYEEKFLEAINDDLNMPVAMSVVWDVIKNHKKSKKFQKLLLKFDQVLGLNLKEYKKDEEELPEEIKSLIENRNIARTNKDWKESDRIRDILIEKGYKVKDSKEGTIVEK